MSILLHDISFPPEGEDAIGLFLRWDGTVQFWRSHAFVGHDVKATELLPHGKLIDADKLIERLQKQLNEASAKVKAMSEYDIGYTPDMYIVDRNRDIISILNAQAAFIPAEENNNDR